MAHDNDITLDIATPNGPFNHTFPKTAPIENVIATTIEAKKLDRNEQFELVHRDKVLEPVERPIGSFDLPDGAKLELTATGSGV